MVARLINYRSAPWSRLFPPIYFSGMAHSANHKKFEYCQEQAWEPGRLMPWQMQRILPVRVTRLVLIGQTDTRNAQLHDREACLLATLLGNNTAMATRLRTGSSSDFWAKGFALCFILAFNVVTSNIGGQQAGDSNHRPMKIWLMSGLFRISSDNFVQYHV